MYVFICTYMYIYICIYSYAHIYKYLSKSIAYAHHVSSVTNVYADVHNTCLTYISAHAWCPKTPVNACRLSAKTHIYSCMCNYANDAAASESLSWKLLRTYLESCTNIMQAVSYHPASCRSRAGPPSSAHPPSCRPPAARC